jgi:allantoin racemase
VSSAEPAPLMSPAEAGAAEPSPTARSGETRILYQSFTDPVAHRRYLDRLSAYLDRIASPDVRFDVRGMTPADTQLGRLSELRCGVQSVAGIIRAERDGYDAVLVGHFQDSCLYAARTAVDIPVVGLGEASLHQACMLGGRIGLVTIDPVYVPWHHEQIRRYGLENRVVAVRAVRITPDQAVAAFDDPGAYHSIRDEFVAQAERMVAESGVDVVMSAGGLFALLSADDHALSVPGALYVNSTYVGVCQAEAAVKIARQHGVPVSRGSTFPRASQQAVREFVDVLRVEEA